MAPGNSHCPIPAAADFPQPCQQNCRNRHNELSKAAGGPEYLRPLRCGRPGAGCSTPAESGLAMIVVSDTSALSNLALVDRLGLLETIYHKVIIPDVVASELVAASNPTISAILQLDWIQTQFLNNFQLANQLQQERGLDAGEANAIALALELQADDLLIDERLGRQEALRLGVPIIGILGILLVAKQRSLIPQVQPVMDALINRAGFRISPQLYQRILVLSQES